jgi:hypothetical protein
MLKKSGIYRVVEGRKRSYAKKSRLDVDSKIGTDGVDELAEDEREAEAAPWKITGKNGCAAAVKALRFCFKDLPEQLIYAYFTGWLMGMVAAIYRFERKEGGKTRSIFFSREKKYILGQLRFSKRSCLIEQISKQFNWEHSELRNEVRVWGKEVNLKLKNVSSGATHFRVISHMSIISDYFYVAKKDRFEPISMLNTMSVCGFSEYLRGIIRYMVGAGLWFGMCFDEKGRLFWQFLKKFKNWPPMASNGPQWLL